MSDAVRPAGGDASWFVEGRLGMFIHWGLYALPARHEWVKNRERLTDADYDPYFRHFDPDLYDPRAWARAAREAGMTYFVVTTKHHEGFCLWDSAHTDYKVTNTPYGRDLLGPMVEAFRAEGLRVGFYHSLIDWHHPEFPIDRVHPQRDDAAARANDEGKSATGAQSVAIRDQSFNPPTLEIPAGTSVNWTNLDATPHTVTSDDGTFDSGSLATHESFSYRFDTPGTYIYHCSDHPEMTGTITVT